MGVLTDPRALGPPPKVEEPEQYLLYTAGFIPPAQDPDAVEIYRGPNIVPPPPGQPLRGSVQGEVLIKLGDNVSTDDILPAGNEVLPLRSNIPAISRYTFAYVDRGFVKRAKRKGGGFIVAGKNYGQGLSPHPRVEPGQLGHPTPSLRGPRGSGNDPAGRPDGDSPPEGANHRPDHPGPQQDPA